MAKMEAAATWEPIDSLTPWDRNPRRNDGAVEQVAHSITRFGFGAPIIARASDRVIIGGHTRYKAAQRLGLDKVPVRFLDLDPAEAAALALADNKLGELAEWDDAGVAAILAELEAQGAPIDGLGWDDDELKALLGDGLEAAPPSDDAPELDEQGEPDSQLGAVYQLGPHRLVCGDSTKEETFAALIGSDVASLVFTDPPYNVGANMSEGFYAGTNSPQMKNLAAAEWDKDFKIRGFLDLLGPRLAHDVTVYICTSQHLAGDIWSWMSEWAAFHGYVVWVKPSPMPSLAKRHWTWSTELICYATRGRHVFNFPEEGHALSHWEISSRDGMREHPTQKPVSLAIHAIRHSSDVGATVLDPFGGSGTTLMACAAEGRIARLIELDPRYCDVIRKRWTRYADENGLDAGPGALRGEVRDVE